VSPHYAAVVSAAFAQRRKTLRNALSQMLSRDEIAACAIDPGARPETLPPAAFNTLALALDRARAGR
jgi:16S rRNA (adenine1518-N6/adenine1519-N6)-dimethyltransferase